jgi:hypothetical protein
MTKGLKTMNNITRSLGFIAGGLLLCSSVSAQTAKSAPVDDTRAYFEQLRAEFNTNKINLYNDVMKLSGPEADKFWPFYRDYEKELAAVGDRKLELIREFFNHYNNNTLTDERSRAIAQKWLQNVQDRLDLWKKYHNRVSKALSPTRGAQFLQLENQMALFVDIAIASEMPVITPTRAGSPTK